MSPRKSSDPEDPLPLRELELELDRELELDELLRELEPLDREPPLKDCPPPGRAKEKVMLGRSAWAWAVAACPSAAAAEGLAIAKAADRTVRKARDGRFRRARLMRAARREAR